MDGSAAYNNNALPAYQNYHNNTNPYQNYDYSNPWNTQSFNQNQQTYHKNHYNAALPAVYDQQQANYIQPGGYYQNFGQQVQQHQQHQPHQQQPKDFNSYGGYAMMAPTGYLSGGAGAYASPRASPQAQARPRRNRAGVGRSMSINQRTRNNHRNRRSPRLKRGRTRGRNNGRSPSKANRQISRYQNQTGVPGTQLASPGPRSRRTSPQYVQNAYRHSGHQTPQRMAAQGNQMLAGNQSPSRHVYDSPSPSKCRNNNYHSSPGAAGWMSPYFPNRGTTPYYGKIDPYSSNQGGSFEPEEQIEYEINDEFLYQNIGGRRRNKKIRCSQATDFAVNSFIDNRRPAVPRTAGVMEKPIMRMSTNQLNSVVPNKTYHFSHELSELGTQYLQVLMSLKNAGTSFEDTDFPPDIRSIVGNSQTAYQDM